MSPWTDAPWALTWFRRLVGAWLVALGLTMVLAGDHRFRGPAYTAMRSVAGTLSASPSLLWGISAIVVGCLTVTHRLRLVGLVLAGTWTALYGIGFASAIRDPRTSPTAAVTYLFVTILIASVFGLERLRQ